MAEPSKAFSPEVLQKIIEAKKEFDASEHDKAEQEAIDPLDDIKLKEPVLEEGYKWFTDIFPWKPKLFTDIPVRVFTPEDWHEHARPYIPERNPNWVWNKEACERFALAMYEGDTTLIYGLQGTGKSCLAQEWCAWCNIPFFRMNCNRETREGHFVGSPGLDYDEEGKMHIKQEPTVLTESLTYGGMFCEDEAFRHNSALVLQSLREKSSRFILLPDAPGRSAAERKLIAPKGRWWYVMTDNTAGLGDETGTFDAQVQDVSTLDRIDAVIEMDYMPKGEEQKILAKHTDLNSTIISKMLDVANAIRVAFKNEKMLTTMSVRALLAWGEKIERTGSINKALQMTFGDKLCTDDKAQLADIYFQVFARKYND